MAMEAMQKSLTLSFLPIDRAANERCENDVFRASNRFTTIFINYVKRKIKKIKNIVNVEICLNERQNDNFVEHRMYVCQLENLHI